MIKKERGKNYIDLIVSFYIKFIHCKFYNQSVCIAFGQSPVYFYLIDNLLLRKHL
jgi:hypothetical protein